MSVAELPELELLYQSAPQILLNPPALAPAKSGVPACGLAARSDASRLSLKMHAYPEYYVLSLGEGSGDKPRCTWMSKNGGPCAASW